MRQEQPPSSDPEEHSGGHHVVRRPAAGGEHRPVDRRGNGRALPAGRRRLAGPGRGIHCGAERLNRRNRGNGDDLARDGRRTGPGRLCPLHRLDEHRDRPGRAACRRRGRPGRLLHHRCGHHPDAGGDRRKPRHPRRSGKHELPRRERNPDSCQRVPVFCGPLGQSGRGHVRVPGRNRGEHHLPGLSARPADHGGTRCS